MTMTIDHQQRHHLSSMGYDNMPFSGTPQFNNPWGSSSGHSYNSSIAQPSPYESLPISKQQTARTPMSIPPYSSIPVTSAAVSSGTYQYGQPELIQHTQPAYEQPYTSAPAAVTSYAPSTSSYATISTYGQALAQQQQDQHSRRISSNDGSPMPQSHSSFGDALDGARGMVSLSQTDITPRNIYGPRGDRSSTDSYGFPAAHSNHSSISSGSTYPSYFGGSIDSSATDYSSASESIDGMSSRTLPRPTGLMVSNPIPAPQSMMGSFNSKVSSSTQKKHKCKVCDKRFTRPSSLQTHVYSHTGEKPFACEVPGCGRNFSVVSNLRRHRKVHKADRHADDDHESTDHTDHTDHGSPEGSWASHE